MWSHTYEFELNSNWTPNHFVCCLEKTNNNQKVKKLNESFY